MKKDQIVQNKNATHPIASRPVAGSRPLRRAIGLLLGILFLLMLVSDSALPARALGEIPVGKRSGSEAVNILLMGRDRAAGLADVMMVMSFHPATGQVSLLQLPRDTYARYTPSVYHKLNGLLAAKGEKETKKTISDALGVPIEYYVAIDMTALNKAVDLLGGVRVDVPVAMDYDDDTQGLHIHLQPGEQVLSGKDAEAFVRYRSGYTNGDLGRMDAQKVFLLSVAHTFVERATPGLCLRLCVSLYDQIKTDVPLGECIRLASAAMRIKPETIHMTTLPGEALRTPGRNGQWYFIPDRAAAAKVIAEELARGGYTTEDFDRNAFFLDDTVEDFRRIYRGEGKTD